MDFVYRKTAFNTGSSICRVVHAHDCTQNVTAKPFTVYIKRVY